MDRALKTMIDFRLPFNGVFNGVFAGCGLFCATLVLFGVQRQMIKNWRMRDFKTIMETPEELANKSFLGRLSTFVFGDLLLYKANLANYYDWCRHLHLRQGKTMLIKTACFVSTPKVSTIDRKNVRFVLGDNWQQFVKGKKHRNIFHELFGSGIFLSNHGPDSEDKGEKWFQQRKVASNIFTLYKFQEQIFDIVETKTTSMMKIFDSRHEFDLQPLLFQFTVDVFSSLAFGVDFDTLGRPPGSHVYSASIDTLQRLCIERFFTPLWKFYRYFRLTANERSIAKSRAEMVAFIKGVIRERREEGCRDKRDIVSRFIVQENPHGDDFLADMIHNLLAGGRDSVAANLSWMMYEVLKHPKILDDLVEELDAGPEFTYDNLMRSADYPMIHGVVWESLRLHPPVCEDAKFSTRDCVLPTGERIPKDTEVEYNVYTMGRDPDVWEAPDEMRPQRWVDSSLSPGKRNQGRGVEGYGIPGTYKRKSNVPEFLEACEYALPIFQAGPRKCIGIDLAIFEAKFIVGTLFKNFNIKLKDPDMVGTNRLGLSVPINEGLPVLCDRRKK